MRNLGVAIVLACAAPTVAVAQEGPLRSELVAYIVERDEISGDETLIRTEDVAPGNIIEYQLVYENVGDAALSGLVVTAPVPASTTLDIDSQATATLATFEASIDDGASWAVPPILIDGPEGLVEAEAAAYDLVRWMPLESIDEGEAWTFSYRVVVD